MGKVIPVGQLTDVLSGDDVDELYRLLRQAKAICHVVSEADGDVAAAYRGEALWGVTSLLDEALERIDTVEERRKLAAKKLREA